MTAGNRIVRPSGARGLRSTNGNGAIVGPAGGTCGCCEAGGNCLLCPGIRPDTLTITFSGITYRSLCCGQTRYTVLVNPNTSVSMELVSEGNGCGYFGEIANGFRKQQWSGANCTGTLFSSDTTPINCLLNTTGAPGGINFNLSLLIADVANPQDGILYDRAAIEISCVLNRSLSNQDTAYQSSCDLGGGGGSAIITL